jgi:hypothetical protein
VVSKDSSSDDPLLDAYDKKSNHYILGQLSFPFPIIQIDHVLGVKIL